MAYRSVFRPGLFKDQTVIVTGGGSGIGRCIAHELASLGATTVLMGRRRERLEQVQAEIIDDGGHADIHALDIRDEDGVLAAVDQMVGRHGQIHGLVNNAGGQFPAALEDISIRGWEAVVRNNLTGGFLMSREVFKQSMKQAGEGAIVNITADHWRGMPDMGHSGAARGGMENFTMTAAAEWGRYGVRVNSVAPGWVASSGFDTYDEEYKAILRSLPAQIPLGRLGRESEVAGAVTFLLSPAAAFVSGSCIRVDGAAPNYPRNHTLPEGRGNAPFDGFHREHLPRALTEDD